jgi:Cu+-exporting ATPase
MGAPDVVLAVEGMMCQRNCGTTVANALKGVAGVTRAEVSFPEKRARVWGTASTSELIETVEMVGFDASVAPDVVLAVEGMMCQRNCGTTVANALKGVAGVTRAEVSFPEKRARIWGTAATSELVETVEMVGFDASVAPANGRNPAPSHAPPTPSAPARQETVAPLVASEPGVLRAKFSISGMSCAACVGNVERNVLGMPGVKQIKVALLAEKAEVLFESETCAEADIVSVVNSLGYEAHHLETGGGKGGVKYRIDISSPNSSAATAEKMEQMLKTMPGVQSVHVDFANRQARRGRCVCVALVFLTMRSLNVCRVHIPPLPPPPPQTPCAGLRNRFEC